MIFALGSGFEKYKNLVIPDEVYLVGHFTKADLPAFSDFAEITKNELDSIRRTLVDLKGSIKYSPTKIAVELLTFFYLLKPALSTASKSFAVAT